MNEKQLIDLLILRLAKKMIEKMEKIKMDSIIMRSNYSYIYCARITSY